ncbi:scaffoldin [Neocallimastix californiae]|uniref:Scaffoldin n=1 Tax=Neocallimastix californiae TaxID=1754190 RepID=A0A1Y2DGE5_9FUNG|nr:scaffoldin [Neocallimastix californiae]|eukprot:ORY58328.1 scaffoldin [Neocallimastix californiae]
MINYIFLRLLGIILLYTYLLKSVKAECSFTYNYENDSYEIGSCEEYGYYLINDSDNSVINDSTTTSAIILQYSSSNNQITKIDTKAGFYINASVKTLNNAIISCSGDPVTCKLITPNENSIYLNNSDDKELIQCVSSCKGFDGTKGTNTPAYYINADTTATSGSYVIECKIDECNTKETTENNIFINANFKEIAINSDSTDNHQLITCKSDGCSPMAISVDSSDKKEYFINSGDETDGTNKYFLITCSNNGSKTTCITDTVTIGSASELFYINGYYDINETSKDNINYLIKCDISSCTPYKPEKLEMGIEYYVHGGADGLKNAIISCTIGNAASCDFIAESNAYSIYINSFTKKLIQCSDNECKSINGIGENNKPAYYKNAAGTATNNSNNYIIKCENTCSTIPGEADSVYLNANNKVESSNNNGEANKPIIICTATNGCTPAEGTVASDSTGYYVNAGLYTNNDVKYELIKCTSTSECEATHSAVTNDITEVYYINQNYSNDGKYLIHCNSSGCTIYSNPTPVDGDEYYIYGGTNNITNAIIKVTISGAGTTKRDISAETSLISPSSTGYEIYINSSSAFKLIQCSSSKCIAFDGSGTSDIPSYYINAGKSSKKILIKCTNTDCIDEKAIENGVYLNANLMDTSDNTEGEPDKPLIICTATNGCTSAEGTINGDSGYYANAGVYTYDNVNYGLIICTSTSVCKAAPSAVSDNITEVYYINQNYSNDGKYLIHCNSSGCTIYSNTTSTDGDEYYIHGGANGLTNAIIKVTLSGTTKRDISAATSLISPSNTGYEIYINSSSAFKLIQCSSTECTAFNGSGTSTIPSYYINAGESPQKILIKCTDTDCTDEDATENSVYLNANLMDSSNNSKGEPDKPLIICTTTNGCTSSQGTVVSDSTGYYVNAGLYTNNNVKYELIKCTTTSECEATHSAVTNDITEVYYINQNYSNDGKYLIHCNSNECKVYSNPTSTDGDEYYIYGGANGLANAIIKVTISGESTVNSSFVTPLEYEIYINSSSAFKLIQCSSTKCTSFNGSGTSTIPSYYINAGKSTQKILIKCTDTNCTDEDATSNGVYLNANLMDSSNNTEGEPNKPLIICTATNECTSSQGTVASDSTGYYVNAGLYTDGSIKYELIKCTSTLVCEAATSAVTDNITEVYYINQNYSNDGNYLINCNSNECIIHSNLTPVNGDEYYINGGANGLSNAIIKVTISGASTTKRDISAATSLISPSSTRYEIYINSSSVFKLIQCSSSKCIAFNGSGTSDIPSYYINAGKSPQKILIKCTNTDCTDEEATENSVYLNANLMDSSNNTEGEPNKPLIICTATNECTSSQGTVASDSTGYYVNAGLYTDGSIKYELIKCTSTLVCEAATSAVTDNITEVYYINQNYSNDGNYLIHCNSNECIIYSNSTPVNGDEYYINGGANGLSNAIIKVTISGASTTKRDISAATSLISPSSTRYEIYINSSSVFKLIQCSSSKCIAFNGSGTSDIPSYYINAGKSPQKILIKCTNTDCTDEEATENSVHLNANLMDSSNNTEGEPNKPLIICTTTNGCTSSQGTVASDSTGYYVNAGLYTDGSIKYELIKCTSTSACIAAPSAVTNDITEVYYINQNYSNDGKYLIHCNSNECIIYSNPTPVNGDEYYIHGGTNNITNAIIKVTISGAGTTKRDISAETSLISPSSTGYEIYINSSSAFKLIQCSSSKCIAFNGSGTSDIPSYYINAGKSTQKILIKCTNTDCTDEDATENGVYLNANLMDTSSNTEGEPDKPLIICTATNGCTSSQGTVASDSKGYYVNAGLYTNNNVKYELIECTTTSACEAAASAVSDNITEVYYINQNYSNDGKYLIHCNSSGCTIYSNPTPVDGDEYYIHGGANGLTNAIIKVTLSGTTKRDISAATSLISPSSTGYEIYINSSSAFKLIQCSSSKCIAFDGSGTSDIPSYYINAGKSPQKILIKCTDTDCIDEEATENSVYLNANLMDTSSNTEGEPDKPLIICTANNGCTSSQGTVASDSTGYYVNAGIYTNNDVNYELIKCTSTSVCEAAASTVTNDITEVYYINQNYSNDENYLIHCNSNECKVYSNPTSTDGDEYYIHGGANGLTNAIIKVTISGENTVNSSFVTPLEYEIYINSSSAFKLIQCSSTKCTSFNGSGTSTIPSYYINAGKSTQKILIKCTDTNCTDEDATSNGVYLNANLMDSSNNTEGEPDKPIIICTATNECTSSQGTVASDSTGYYVNAGLYTDGSIKYELIKCTSTLACEAATSAVTDNITEVYYINQNYSNDGNYLIHCNSSGCTIYSNSTPVDGDEYYIHGGANGLTNAIIKVTISGASTTKRDISAATSLISPSSTRYEIYINSSSEFKLIQCSSTECTSFNGSGTSDIPSYFINAGKSTQKILIKCTDTDCTDEEAIDNGVYLNANLMDSINNSKGEPNKPLIVCTAADSCTSAEGTINGGSGYYVNAGVYTEAKPLIKCTSTKECILDGVTFGTEVTEVFYINGNKMNDGMYLIKCTSTDTTNPCTIYENPENRSTTEYYVHGAPEGLDKAIIKVEISSESTTESLIEHAEAYDIYYNTFTSLLIQCSNEACTAFSGGGTDKIPNYYINADAAIADEFIITCDETNKCKRTKGAEHDVYLNGNLKESSNNPNGEADKPLIICTETECVSAIGTLTNDIGFYVNAGTYEDNENKINPLIKCTTTTTCEATTITFETDITEHFYINGNKEKDNHYLIHCLNENECEIYINRNKTPGKEYYIHGDADNLTKAIIQVSIDEVKDQSGEEIQESITCTLINGEETQIYLNSSPNHNLIQCFKSDDNSTGCTEFEGTGDVNEPIYYVNAAVATDDSYDKLLIQCEDTCHEAKGAQSNVYLNANLKTSSNSKGDSVNHLIICNEKKCEVKANEVVSGKYEYYVNAGTYNANPLIDTLIECSNSESIKCETKDMSKLGVGTATLREVFFINKNYGVDPTNYIIKCSGEKGCEAYGSADENKLTEFYVHGHPDETNKLLDGVIECNFKVATMPCELIDSADKNSIYLNKYTNLLIQCSDEESGCQAYEGKGEINKPVYYLNTSPTVKNEGEYKNLLIECRETCQEYTGDTNQVYLNANFKTDANANGDDEHHLIICNGANCNLLSSTVESGKFEYYVNAGSSNEVLLKDTLIECSHTEEIRCEEKDITEIVNDTTVTEVFFINKIYDPEYDNENYVICCTTSTGCQPYNSKSKKERGLEDEEEEEEEINEDNEDNEDNNESMNEYYVNGGSIALLEDSLIKCIFGEQVASCSSDKENSGAQDKNVYLNAYSNDKIIRCTEAKGCYSVNVSNILTDKQSAYFINSNDKESESVIKCSTLNKCEITSEGLNEGNKVYLNANFDVNGDMENQLIHCQEGFCELLKSEANEEKDEFYYNGDPTDTEVLNNDIIKCHKKENEEGVFCELISPKPNEIYLNADFVENINVYQIIICSDQGCKETLVKEASETTIKFYVNSGALMTDKLKDTLILCDDNSKACRTLEAKNEEIYINNYTKQLIICTTKTGCIAKESNAKKDTNEYYLNASDLHTEGQEKLTDDLIKCSLGNNEIPQCYFQSGKPNEIYVNGYNPYPFMEGRLIYCQQTGGCKPRNIYPTMEEPLYFINSDDHTFMDDEGTAIPMELTPLQKSLIKCKNSGSNESPKVKCEVTDGKVGDIYRNGNFNRILDENQEELGDNTNHLIKCNESKGCELTSSNASEVLLPEYYINSGHLTRLNDAIIKCVLNNEEITCDIQSANINDIYINSNIDELDTLPLIKCAKSGCNTSKSAATEKSNEYYKNSGDVNEDVLVYDIIECSIKEEKIEENVEKENAEKEKRENERKSKEERKVNCRAMNEINPGTYINANYSPMGDNTQMILCISGIGCKGLKSQSTNKIMEYYANSESTDITNAIIFCHNTKCEKQTPETVPSYYVGVSLDEDEVTKGLIECVSEDSPCILRSPFTSTGYYLNAGYNKAINQTIRCDIEEGCQTLKVDLGYYVNAGNTEKPIIKCEKENAECEEEATKKCPTPEKSVGGDYCFEDNVLKFYPSSNSTSVTVNKSSDYYAYAKLAAGSFPGLKKETSTLYKITPYSINRFYQSGVVMIDKTGRLVDSTTFNQVDTTIYKCNDATKICTKRPNCNPLTYMYDSENKKALFCNEKSQLEYATFTGYVIDGDNMRGKGHRTSYLIKCENGEDCINIKPNQKDSFYENNGYNADKYALIQCQSNNCKVVEAHAGFYLGHSGQGVIQCTSETSCTFKKVLSKIKFINSGEKNPKDALIECQKNGECKLAKGKLGHYMTYTSKLLIQCTGQSTCKEITPTPNYYENADSTDEKSTIINCVESGNVVSCTLEVANNGFYSSSKPFIIIRCKNGNKCKPIKVNNGFFVGAVENTISNSGSKSNSNSKSRDIRDYNEFEDIYDIYELDNPEETQTLIARDIYEESTDSGWELLESDEIKEIFNIEEEETVVEDGDNIDELNQISRKRESEETHGIIRCVGGKCNALSIEEVAAIPICEFNKNKCYITLEYSMTESATTSLSAGNICTNSDRSIFYFATDTIVVKPNVIAGVTSTYVYTTTSTNCLEVNESLNDKYFTVDSSIYILDEGSVIQYTDPGYLFINTASNELVTTNDIKSYNDANVKLFYCNGLKCQIENLPNITTYYADVNKRILKYNPEKRDYSFAYDKDIKCIYKDSKCTPNADLKNQEFCITYKGELALINEDIKNRETGDCYKAKSITSNILGHYNPQRHLYQMNINAAQIIHDTGYFIVNLMNNNTVSMTNVKPRNNKLVLYGCQKSICDEYEPEEGIYYYDDRAKILLQYHEENDQWTKPKNSGYAFISLNPLDSYIYKFSIGRDDKVIIEGKVPDGYYYTVDGEMYSCDRDRKCQPIEDSGYYFTKAGQVYYCVYDSEEIYPTECTKQLCVSGQFYYINNKYYRCNPNSDLTQIYSRHCSRRDYSVLNFPVDLTDKYPDNVRRTMRNIIKNNNNSPVVSFPRSKKLLKSVSSIVTNCTYDVEETQVSFDLVCINNQVRISEEDAEVQICSIEQFGYIECIDDDNNPQKCNVSGALLIILRPSIFKIFLFTLFVYFTLYLNDFISTIG